MYYVLIHIRYTYMCGHSRDCLTSAAEQTTCQQQNIRSLGLPSSS